MIEKSGQTFSSRIKAPTSLLKKPSDNTSAAYQSSIETKT
jgi:hypothetical protein